ncbi:MAG: SRPBCC family protein [Bacteroidetes bacterium]|nr:SRPBCC family protein [Bacteroidota bacterium]MCW5894451.1 SRPBCC family protein [Bacteroidota bacterium]
MNVHTLTRVQTLDYPIDEVFEFFRSPENLARITPPWLNFRILTPLPLEMHRGTLIDYTVNWLGMPVRWTTNIVEFNPPHHFVDLQISGPYSFWHHTHTFLEQNGKTDMRDEVRYVLPFGIFGEAVHRLIVRRQLEEIFDYRERAVRRQFAEPKIVRQYVHSEQEEVL